MPTIIMSTVKHAAAGTITMITRIMTTRTMVTTMIMGTITIIMDHDHKHGSRAGPRRDPRARP